MRWTPALLVPAPFQMHPLNRCFPGLQSTGVFSTDFSEHRLAAHYPARSPLDDVLKLVTPGSDAYLSEKYASELAVILASFSRQLLDSPPALETLARILAPAVSFTSIDSAQVVTVRNSGGIRVQKRRFAAGVRSGRENFLAEAKRYWEGFRKLDVAEFEIVGFNGSSRTARNLESDVRYRFVGTTARNGREERAGIWKLSWSQSPEKTWSVNRWAATEESVSSATSPLFRDVTELALGKIPSYQKQLTFGVDHWRSVIDGACGIDVYGNNGIAAGDFDGDGFDDLYICQPSGLPNRLYRNRGDGTFEDATEASGVGILDATSCAIFADFENKGVQDLVVVCASGPLLFLNQGNGKFQIKRDAFRFATPPQGTFTHASVADYDRDGRLDIYFCLYSYYLGLEQYHYPSPYFDARNGPPNFLFHNEGSGQFVDRTTAAGLDAENDRFSFACAWGDSNGDGHPDLYVANDFGRSNLYRNRADGTFEAVSEKTGVNDPGAGMSACWSDFDNSGNQDIYVSNMWSAAGQRVSAQDIFQSRDSKEIRSLYQRHARGNSLYKNLGDGNFKNVSPEAGVEMGRWAWGSDSWDFDHDGYSDLYIANGYISGPDRSDLGSFFWRQVVGNSPATANPSPSYERGWNAINELIRSDSTWSGFERNTLYLNNRDGSFSEVSGIAGLDFLDDSRSFALADIDHDGRLEVILKNRNAPQIRVLHNSMSELGDGIAIRLRGRKSNRDGIGASVTVQAGSLRQTKYVQAGSGFLSQHSKDLFFGLAKAATAGATISASIRWPSGATQTFENLPFNHRISIEEAGKEFSAAKFGESLFALPPQGTAAKLSAETRTIETWILDPLPAPDFSLPDLGGKTIRLAAFQGRPLLLHFWIAGAPECAEQLNLFERTRSVFEAENLQVLCVNVDEPHNLGAARALIESQRWSIPHLFATPDVAGIYNILYRYLFDRRRDLPLPSSFLLDEKGAIVKLFQGIVRSQQFVKDVAAIPRTTEARVRAALPFAGISVSDAYRRNDFTYGVALFQRGYLDQAAASFKQVIAAKPEEPEAYYNLGTLYLRKNELIEAQKYLEQTVKLRPEYPEAWNNLGMIAGQQNRADDAVRDFKKSLAQRPDYTVAIVNLGNIYRRQGNISEASELFNKALGLEPENAEANYSFGMLYARQNNSPRAIELLQKAASLRPDYAEAWNNLGVLYVRAGQNSEAEAEFKKCIEVSPGFDQAYLNLAQLYVLSNDKERARGVLQALLKLQPQHKVAQQALGMLD